MIPVKMFSDGGTLLSMIVRGTKSTIRVVVLMGGTNKEQMAFIQWRRAVHVEVEHILCQFHHKFHLVRAYINITILVYKTNLLMIKTKCNQHQVQQLHQHKHYREAVLDLNLQVARHPYHKVVPRLPIHRNRQAVLAH